MRHFKHPKNIEDLKEQHRRLAKLLHPDHGGSEHDFADMEAEYDMLLQTMQECERRHHANREVADAMTDVARSLWGLVKASEPRLGKVKETPLFAIVRAALPERWRNIIDKTI